LFRTLPLTLTWGDDWVDRALATSRAVGTSTIYDALYLACAEDESAELFTCDSAFCRAFGDNLPQRVKLFEPE
jgi:predicted nucleic acid-binding protein